MLRLDGGLSRCGSGIVRREESDCTKYDVMCGAGRRCVEVGGVETTAVEAEEAPLRLLAGCCSSAVIAGWLSEWQSVGRQYVTLSPPPLPSLHSEDVM